MGFKTSTPTLVGRGVVGLDDEDALIRRLRTVKSRVEYVLENYPETRNDDRYLWLIYIRLFCPEMSKYIRFIPYDVLKNAPTFETIRRCRQKIQEQGMYLPTDPEVLARRRRLAEAYRHVIPKL